MEIMSTNVLFVSHAIRYGFYPNARTHCTFLDGNPYCEPTPTCS